MTQPAELLLILDTNYAKAFAARPHRLVSFLEAKGYRLTVLYPDKTLSSFGPTERVPSRARWRAFFRQPVVASTIGSTTFIKLTPPPLPTAFLYLLQPWWFARLYRRHINRRFAVGIAQMPKGGRLALRLRRSGFVGKVLYEDLDYFPGFFPGLQRAVQAISRVLPPAGRRLSRLAESYERRVVVGADRVISVSQSLAALRRSQGQSQVTVVENGVDVDAWHRPREQRHGSVCHLVYVGALDPFFGVERAIDGFVQAHRQRPNLRLTIIGDGQRRPALERLVRSHGLTTEVHWLGHIAKKELPDILKTMHIGLATYQPIPLMAYAFTLKIVEYLAAGLPVIATRIGETARLIEQSNSGLLTADTDSVAAAIVRLHDEPGTCAAMGRQGTAFARRFDWPQLLQREQEILNQLFSTPQ